MLTPEQVKQLHIDSPTFFFQQKPEFIIDNTLWYKQQLPEQTTHQKISSLFQFSKFGKTFGLETKRYAAIKGKYMLYYNNRQDIKPAGFCNLENVYVYFLHTSQGRHLLYITNGKYSSKFYFENQEFINIVRQLCKNVIIQLNFSQRYTSVNFLGQGSFSKVYLSRRNQDDQLYASKVVSKLDKNGSPTHKSVVYEKIILSRLTNCEYIYKFQEFFQEGQNYIFVIEYLKGTDLMSVMKNQEIQFTYEQKITLLRSILEAVAYCHKENIIHRDLKPQNIIVDMDNGLIKPKLIDFGLSLVFSGSNQLTDFKRCGTMGYMAPQVVQNSSVKRRAYDYKCDIFSFGIIAHMLLIGFNPLKGKNYEQTYLLNKQCSIQLNKQNIIEQYDENCFQFLLKILQKNPKIRPSAEQVLKLPIFEQKQKLLSTADKAQFLDLKRGDKKFQQSQQAIISLGLVEKQFNKIKPTK